MNHKLTVFRVRHLNILSTGRFPMMLLKRSSDAAFTVRLQIDTFKRRPPWSRHHVNPGPEPLLELVLPSQSTLGEITFIIFIFIQMCPSSSLPWSGAAQCVRPSVRWACRCSWRPTLAASITAGAGAPPCTQYPHIPAWSSTDRAGSPTPPAQTHTHSCFREEGAHNLNTALYSNSNSALVENHEADREKSGILSIFFLSVKQMKSQKMGLNTPEKEGIIYNPKFMMLFD